MIRSKRVVYKTRRRNVVTRVREHYLRDDIRCGWAGCRTCASRAPRGVPGTASAVMLEQGTSHVLILDTNVLLHQMDLLKHEFLTNVVVLQTVLEETRARNPPAHRMMRDMILDQPQRHLFVFPNEHHRETYVDRSPGESSNDRNDRAIRVATLWYQQHLPATVKVVLLTNDKDNKTKALADGLQAYTVREWVESQGDSSLLDMVAQTRDDDLVEDIHSLYEKHWSTDKIKRAFHAGEAVRARFYVDRDSIGAVSAVGVGYGLEGDTTVASKNAAVDNLMGTHASGKLLCAGGRVAVAQGREAINRAVDGDIVCAVLEEPFREQVGGGGDEGEHRPRARIVGIVRRGWKPLCGSLLPASHTLSGAPARVQSRYSVRRGWRILMPVDDRLPLIHIRTAQSGEALDGKRIVVSLDQWNRDQCLPQGHFVRVLGNIGDKAVESEAILIQHGVSYQPFPERVLRCLPPEGPNFTISDDERAKRVDLRQLDIVSIDPPGCTDIDDALHCRPIDNAPDGSVRYEVGVHIADVTHFVKENTSIDKEASERGSTVYLVDRRIDMLPELLGTNLCSLRSNVERLAFSCVWIMDEEANVIDMQFHKSVIKSRHAFTYGEAQDRIDDPERQDGITHSIRQLMALSKKLKQRRMEAGALALSSPAVKFVLEGDDDVDGEEEGTKAEGEAQDRRRDRADPVDVELYQSRDTNSLVEEFMLLANVSVAAHIEAAFPSFAVLRHHPAPTPGAFDSLRRALSRLSPPVPLRVDSSKELAESLDEAVLEGRPYFNTLVRIMTTRSMQQARYFSSGTAAVDQYHHYGLAAPIYTHFTSPIRRYADVLVHRLLAASINYAPLPASMNNRRVDRMCQVINHRHRMAQQSARASVQLHTLVFFKGRSNVIEEGYVTRTAPNAVGVIIPKYGFESSIHVTDDEGTYDEQTEQVHFFQRSSQGKRSLQVFDRVRVSIHVDTSQPIRPVLVLRLLKPSSNAMDTSTSLPSIRDVKQQARTTTTPSSSSSPSGRKATKGKQKAAAKKAVTKRSLPPAAEGDTAVADTGAAGDDRAAKKSKAQPQQGKAAKGKPRKKKKGKKSQTPKKTKLTGQPLEDFLSGLK